MEKTVYRLYDIYEGKTLVVQSSELNIEWFKAAAKQRDKDTDGECTLVLRRVTVEEIPFTY